MHFLGIQFLSIETHTVGSFFMPLLVFVLAEVDRDCVGVGFGVGFGVGVGVGGLNLDVDAVPGFCRRTDVCFGDVFRRRPSKVRNLISLELRLTILGSGSFASSSASSSASSTSS